jgi:hypothetical protein
MTADVHAGQLQTDVYMLRIYLSNHQHPEEHASLSTEVCFLVGSARVLFPEQA